jgi:hypothetical protein
MASTNVDEIGVRPLTVQDWSLGINTSKPRTEIEDNEAQEILNMEFDDSGNLSTRRGIQEFLATTFGSRITSLHYFVTDAGEEGILFTSGDKLFIAAMDGSGSTDISGVLVFPSDTYWQWVTFGGLAIGVNKATSGTNPVKVDTSSVAAQLGGTAPKGKYIEVWNSRVWIISATEPNKIWGSSLNNAEDWTTTGAAGKVELAIDPDDGDEITGLFATRSALYVFKSKRIYRIVAASNLVSAADATNLKVEIYAQNIGCVSPYSIKQVIDDVVFLSEQGLASLKLAEAVEDFRTALFSKNVATIARTPKSTDEIPLFNFDTASQVWLTFPAVMSLTGSNQTFVMDYFKLNENILRWTRFDGLASGTCYTAFPSNSGKTYLIGAENAAGTFQIFKYIPRDITAAFNDDDEIYTKQLVMKAYNVNLPLMRKQFMKWGIGFDLLTNTVAIAVQYYLDGNISKGGTYGFNLSGEGTGALWDEALWDVALWDTAVVLPQDIVRKLLSNSSGQRGQDITFIVTNAQLDQGFVIKNFMLFFSLLSEKKVTDV